MNLLKIRRKQLKLSQAYLAGLIGVTTAAYCDYENGRKTIPVDKAELVAKTLKISVNKIFLPARLAVRYSDEV